MNFCYISPVTALFHELQRPKRGAHRDRDTYEFRFHWIPLSSRIVVLNLGTRQSMADATSIGETRALCFFQYIILKTLLRITISKRKHGNKQQSIHFSSSAGISQFSIRILQPECKAPKGAKDERFR